MFHMEFTLCGRYADGYQYDGRRPCLGAETDRLTGPSRSSVPTVSRLQLMWTCKLHAPGAHRQLDGSPQGYRMSASASEAFEGRFMDRELYRQQALRARDLADRGPIRSPRSFFWLSATPRGHRGLPNDLYRFRRPDRPGTDRQRMKKPGRGRGPLRPAQRHRISDAAPAGT
jgi:hypothetical protein